MKNKEKYNLKELKIKWVDDESMEIYADDGVYRRISDNNAVLLRELVNWLESEYKEPILDDKEKEYLSAVIRPWRDRVKTIGKQKVVYQAGNEKEYISIDLYDDFINLPIFEAGSMYKGMQLSKRYSLENLGL